jgi:pimeloyl-ACP methyl ester carboxylesterase
MECAAIDDAELEYEVQGHGEPVLLIAPAAFSDGLARPLFGQTALARKYQLIHYRRRGYRGSTRGLESLTIARQAQDAAGLLRELGAQRAHVVGHSYGGVIALQLAVDAPDLVHSLALLEPALRSGPAGQAHLEQTVGPAREKYRAGDKRGFVLFFSERMFGTGWEPVVDRTVPGAIEQAVVDADVFYEEQPALLDWVFGSEEAAAIRQPVLSVLGARSAAIFQEGRAVLHNWFPGIADFDVNTTHMLQLEDPTSIANGLATFFGRNPIALS